VKTLTIFFFKFHTRQGNFRPAERPLEFKVGVSCVEINQCLHPIDVRMNATPCTNLPLKAMGFNPLAPEFFFKF
jgi:hypothetical protein